MFCKIKLWLVYDTLKYFVLREEVTVAKIKKKTVMFKVRGMLIDLQWFDY